MDSLILKSLIKWKELSNKEEVTDHLLAVMQYTSEMLHTKDTSTLDNIRYLLEQTIYDERPSDLQSFNLGLAHGISQMIIYWMALEQFVKTCLSLSLHEKSVLFCLAANPRITPMEIMVSTHSSELEIVTYSLRQLRNKELVSYWEAGSHRWYSLTSSGEKAIKLIQTGGVQDVHS